jgi:hypothetical protein
VGVGVTTGLEGVGVGLMTELEGVGIGCTTELEGVDEGATIELGGVGISIAGVLDGCCDGTVGGLKARHGQATSLCVNVAGIFQGVAIPKVTVYLSSLTLELVLVVPKNPKHVVPQ